MEYVFLLTLIIASLIVMQKYILGGIAGRWKSAGDAFGKGEQYDPKKTTECAWSETQKTWYSSVCYQNAYDANFAAWASGCLNTCINQGTLDKCGGVSSCSTSLDKTVCCQNECDTDCPVAFETATVSQCKTYNGISCN